jgi:hypothetical protein
MRTLFSVFAGVVALIAASVRPAGATSIFVDKDSTALTEDGSARAPYRTITKALERARKIRFGPQGNPDATIVVHVAPSPTPYVGSFGSADPSKERLPLLLNVPKLKLKGGTRLVVGPDGLPTAVVAGTETTLRGDLPQGPRQYFVLVTRTKAKADSGFDVGREMAGNDVEISGFVLQAETGRQLPSALVGVDGVKDFVIRDNALTNGGNGVWTRLASGRIEGNLARDNFTAIFVSGGSKHFPASVNVAGNRVDAAGVAVMAGIGLIGGGETGNRRTNLDVGANPFTHEAPPAVFDRFATPDDVPDMLAADVVGNRVTGYQFGLRCAGYLQDPYGLVAGQDEAAHVKATFRRNSATASSFFGLVVDAAQIGAGDRRSIDMDLSFEDTTLDGLTAPAVFSFWRGPGSFELSMTSPIPFMQPNQFALPNPSFARNSTIKVCGDVTRFFYDNRQDPDPPTNPPPLVNHMTINNVDLTGRWPNSPADLGTEMPVPIPATSHDCTPQ